MTEQRKRKLKRQLQESRYRLRQLNEEFAEPLRNMVFVATKDVMRISTNGHCIYFDPDWLQKLGHTELDFMLSHQLMHIVLGHVERPKYYTGDRFHLACDIVANSHLELLGWKYEKLPHVGKIFHETFFPEREGRSMTAQEALKCVPFDPALMKPALRRNYMIDSEMWWDKKSDRGETGEIVLSPADEDPEDILNDEDNTGGNHFYVRKEMFPKDFIKSIEDEPSEEKNKQPSSGWDRRAMNNIRSLRNAMNGNDEAGAEETFVERTWQRVNIAKLNWRKLLNSFIQEEVCDYFFTPPDRRMQDSEFFLPDYNVLLERPKEVLFMVDTSGSIDDDMLSAVYGEICNALTQFNGGLVGVLCFFDVRVHNPMPFSDIEDLLRIKPCGGGGTNYDCIFDYVERIMRIGTPNNIVIFTDGVAKFPEESAANNIPVLWLFSNQGIKPPWGKYAYVE